MTLDEALLAVEVLRTPLGGSESGDSPRVMALREDVRQLYEKLKHENPHWTFSMASRWARAQWLWAYTNHSQEKKL